MKCETCKGLGFKEYEAGLIQVECEECHGTGEIPDDDRSSIGIGLPNTVVGSPNPRKPKQPKKPKAKKQTSRRHS